MLLCCTSFTIRGSFHSLLKCFWGGRNGFLTRRVDRQKKKLCCNF